MAKSTHPERDIVATNICQQSVIPRELGRDAGVLHKDTTITSITRSNAPSGDRPMTILTHEIVQRHPNLFELLS